MPGPSLLLSIVCPVYEDEAALPARHQELATVLASLEADWRVEILYVEDGSPDQSLGVIKTLAAQDARVRFVSLSRHFGTEAAWLAGMEHARGDAVITLNAKCGHPPQLVPELLKKWRNHYEVVVGADVGSDQVITDLCLLSRKACCACVKATEACAA
jgi:glycosyltransferase involved in cell wall biosynthesis